MGSTDHSTEYAFLRTLRSTHLPADRIDYNGVIVDARYTAGRVTVNDILKQCLCGGVLRWLQIACVDDFDRIVQVVQVQQASNSVLELD